MTGVAGNVRHPKLKGVLPMEIKNRMNISDFASKTNDGELRPNGTKSLLSGYQDESITYIVNASGDITAAADDDLTPTQQMLFDTYWDAGSGVPLYVMDINGKSGIGVVFCVDRYAYMDNSLPSNEAADKLTVAGVRFACWMAENAPEGVSIYFGDETDPNGSEVMAFIPADLCDRIIGHDGKTIVARIEKAWNTLSCMTR